jgi:citrate lyase subunit beta/citryl-CoA lyase
MRLRSQLFVPGDSERKFAKASSAAADALILDLEDSVAPRRRPPRVRSSAGWSRTVRLGLGRCSIGSTRSIRG